MRAIIGILAAAAIICLWELPSLVKKKYWKDLFVFFLFLVPGVTLSILLAKNVVIPTPADWLMKIYSPVTAFFEQILT